MTAPAIDTANEFAVSWMSGGDHVAIVLPVIGAIPKPQALRLAAWLVALADPLGEDFPAVLEAVRST